MLSKVSLDSVCQRVTLFSRKNVRHVLHHPNIRIETSEWLTVGLTPAPEDHPLRCNRTKNHSGRLTDLGFDGCLRTFTLLTALGYLILSLVAQQVAVAAEETDAGLWAPSAVPVDQGLWRGSLGNPYAGYGTSIAIRFS